MGGYFWGVVVEYGWVWYDNGREMSVVYVVSGWDCECKWWGLCEEMVCVGLVISEILWVCVGSLWYVMEWGVSVWMDSVCKWWFCRVVLWCVKDVLCVWWIGWWICVGLDFYI